MAIHPKTQTALDAAHGALDKKRRALLAIAETADQSQLLKGLNDVKASIDALPMPVISDAPKSAKRKAARRR